MATIKDDPFANLQIEPEQPEVVYICGCDFVDPHESNDWSATCVISFKLGQIFIEEMKTYKGLSIYAMERSKEITAIQTEIATRFPGVKFIKQNK